MTSVKAYKFKLKPNKKFQANCEQTLAVCRELYNASIQERRDAWKISRVSVSSFEQMRELTEIKELRDDVKAVHSQVLQDVLKRSDKAFANFFRRCKQGETPGFPRFKSKDRYDSFTYPQSGFKLASDKLYLSKIGSCRLRLSREIEGKIKTCTVKRECDGWYVIFAVEPSEQASLPKTNKVVGVDLGLESFATLSTGAQIENPRFFKTAAPALAEAQRKLSTKQRGSGKRKAAKKIVAKTQRKIQNQRKDFSHKLANDFVQKFDAIALEDLNVKGMQQRWNAKSVADVSWSTFTSILSYKAEEAGRKVIFVNPAYTSQDCSACGHRQKIDQSVRWYDCPKCGLSLHRDHNAAINIERKGFGKVFRFGQNLTVKSGISLYNAALSV
jgi:putative transposase